MKDGWRGWMEEVKMGPQGYLIDAPKDAALEGRKIAMRGNT